MRISDWSSDVCSSDLHMGMLVVLELLPPLGRRISETVSLVLVGGFALGMIWYGGHLAIVTAHDNIPSVDLPQGVFYAALPLSGVAIVLFVIERLIAAALGYTVEKDAYRDHRSEEHTSELQSLMRISYAVFCLKKKKPKTTTNTTK